MVTFRIVIKIWITIFLSNSLFAQVKLPTVFSDHMVIQRNQPLKVWGIAEKGEKITVFFNGAKVSTNADKAGNWLTQLPSFKEGGPYQLKIQGKNTIILNDILIGDVWFCSGQSNMGMSVLSSKNSTEELNDAHYPQIRLFTTPNQMSEQPQSDLKMGSWVLSNSETVKDFSAVSFFFGRKLFKDLHVPIGLVNSSWGGTDIQSWISSEGISKFEAYQPAMELLKTKNYELLTKERDLCETAWYDSIRTKEAGVVGKWYLPEINDANWTEVNMPTCWEQAGFQGDGVGWFRKEFELNDEEASATVIIQLSKIHNAEQSYLNGEKIGECDIYNQPRIYPVSPQNLRKGKNILAVKVYNYWGNGGFIGKADEMFYQSNAVKKSLAGVWKFKPGYFSINPALVINPNNFPTLLYNTKVNPLVNFAIKGVLWYQGENNTGNPDEYRQLLPALINDWRKHWNIGDFPFLIVQLPNFMASDDVPTDGIWAKFRESQAAALSLPNTGMAVTIDVGETDDIHPLNKQDVAYRLSLIAEGMAFNKNIVFSGPSYKSFKTLGDKAFVEFSDLGSGLMTHDKYGFVKGFTISGTDRKFYWAKAFIEGNKVVVFSENVSAPVAIRYAWGNNPDASLYNSENLPAAPFRTDNW